MIEYQNCKCGSAKTYISQAGNTCCSACFVPLDQKIPEETPNLTAYVKTGDHGFSVMVNGETVKFFTKYEDYALTEARAYANKLNAA